MPATQARGFGWVPSVLGVEDKTALVARRENLCLLACHVDATSLTALSVIERQAEEITKEVASGLQEKYDLLKQRL